MFTDKAEYLKYSAAVVTSFHDIPRVWNVTTSVGIAHGRGNADMLPKVDEWWISYYRRDSRKINEKFERANLHQKLNSPSGLILGVTGPIYDLLYSKVFKIDGAQLHKISTKIKIYVVLNTSVGKIIMKKSILSSKT